MGSLSLLQGIFPTQGSSPGLLHWRRFVYQLSHKGNSCGLRGKNLKGKKCGVEFPDLILKKNFSISKYGWHTFWHLELFPLFSLGVPEYFWLESVISLSFQSLLFISWMWGLCCSFYGQDLPVLQVSPSAGPHMYHLSSTDFFHQNHVSFFTHDTFLQESSWFQPFSNLASNILSPPVIMTTFTQ